MIERALKSNYSTLWFLDEESSEQWHELPQVHTTDPLSPQRILSPPNSFKIEKKLQIQGDLLELRPMMSFACSYTETVARPKEKPESQACLVFRNHNNFSPDDQRRKWRPCKPGWLGQGLYKPKLRIQNSEPKAKRFPRIIFSSWWHLAQHNWGQLWK